MKKFASIVCALMMIMSATAAEKVGMNLSQNQQTIKVERSIKNANKKMIQAIPGRRIVMDQNLVATDVSEKYYATDNDWYIQYTDGETFVIAVDIIAEEDATLTAGKTYTFSDMLADYTLIQTAAGNFEATACSYVYTVDADGLKHVVIDMAAGGENYHMTYDEEPLPAATDTIEIAMREVKIMDYCNEPSLGAYQLQGTSDEFEIIYIAAKASQIVGVVSEIWTDYTGLYVDEDNMVEILAGDGSITAGANEGEYNISFYLLSEDAHCYHITSYYTAPHAETSMNYVATDLVIDASLFDLYMMFYGYGMFSVAASNADGDLYMEVQSMDNVSGTYTENDLAGTVCGSDIYAANITVDEAANTVTGTVLCYNNVEYTLDLSFVLPEANDTIVLTDLTGKMVDACEAYGWWQAMTPEDVDDWFVTLSPNAAEELAGHYYVEDMDLSYTYVIDMTDTTQYAVLDADIIVTEENGMAYVDAELLTWDANDHSNVVLFQITMVLDIEVETALENAKSDVEKAVKVLRNGQVVIRNAEKEYNVNGAQL